MHRFPQIVLIASTLAVSWLGMMVVHECGHVTGALVTGGKVKHVALPLIGFSRTDVSVNPRPLIVVWAGPVLGSIVPLLAWAAMALLKLQSAYLMRFFAGYCLIANGAYIGAGSFDQVGDTYVMLLFGSRMWQLWLFGAMAFSAGLFLWHRQGSHFGIGPDARAVKPLHAWAMTGLLTGIITIELLLARGSWRG
jgi:hypothetical protein